MMLGFYVEIWSWIIGFRGPLINMSLFRMSNGSSLHFLSLSFPGQRGKCYIPPNGPYKVRAKRAKLWKRLKFCSWKAPIKQRSHPCSGHCAWPLGPTSSSPASIKSSRTYSCLLGLRSFGEKPQFFLKHAMLFKSLWTPYMIRCDPSSSKRK